MSRHGEQAVPASQPGAINIETERDLKRDLKRDFKHEFKHETP
jgi:hypothetical protein